MQWIAKFFLLTGRLSKLSSCYLRRLSPWIIGLALLAVFSAPAEAQAIRVDAGLQYARGRSAFVSQLHLAAPPVFRLRPSVSFRWAPFDAADGNPLILAQLGYPLVEAPGITGSVEAGIGFYPDEPDPTASTTWTLHTGLGNSYLFGHFSVRPWSIFTPTLILGVGYALAFWR